MMAYAFQFPIMDEKRFLHSSNESFENLEQLIAYLLNDSLDTIFKQGMHYEYVSKDSFLRRPKGKMNITKTVSTPYKVKGEIYCEYDNFSLDNPFNQVIKKTILVLLKSIQVEPFLKTKLKNKLMLLYDVQDISFANYNWSHFKYSRNNRNYRFVIYLAKLLNQREIFNSDVTPSNIRAFMDSQDGHQLFEKFILNYYKVHYPKLRSRPAIIEWNTTEENLLLPIMRTDVFLDFEDHKTILEVKFYKDALLSSGYNSANKLRSQHLYQLYSYLDNYKLKNPTTAINGILLYAITSDAEKIDEDLKLSQHNLFVNSVSLHKDFKIIKSELESILNLEYS
jgi:5-methylcytosine-specific restriction enzyme subunit McrC